jgi:hypothetical protein
LTACSEIATKLPKRFGGLRCGILWCPVRQSYIRTYFDDDHGRWSRTAGELNVPGRGGITLHDISLTAELLERRSAPFAYAGLSAGVGPALGSSSSGRSLGGCVLAPARGGSALLGELEWRPPALSFVLGSSSPRRGDGCVSGFQVSGSSDGSGGSALGEARGVVDRFPASSRWNSCGPAGSCDREERRGGVPLRAGASPRLVVSASPISFASSVRRFVSANGSYRQRSSGAKL